MSGIAGIAAPGRIPEVTAMLEAMSHRGRGEMHVFESGGVCMGAVAAPGKLRAWDSAGLSVRDEAGPGHFARASVRSGTLELRRDPVGAAPLYFGWTRDGAFCFASEVKGLLVAARQVNELLPGSRHDGTRQTLQPPLAVQEPCGDPPALLATRLRAVLDEGISARLDKGTAGAWLSGGLDSSALTALAFRQAGRLHTFAGGVAGASDLLYAREVARCLGTEHHEIVLSLDDVLESLPEVVASLESFDALLVRSGVVNHHVGRIASEHVDAVFSGEGSDELFAGYAYLKDTPPGDLAEELADITHRLHNTALQRVDRCAAAHGLTAHTCFLDPNVVSLAFRIPPEYKIRNGIEKWILRQALEGLLPEAVLYRPKVKFWQGAGMESLLAEHCEARISNADFSRERVLANGWVLSSKEELMYYRLFRERFGELPDLGWMGRTKNAHPEDAPEVLRPAGPSGGRRPQRAGARGRSERRRTSA